MRYEELKTKYCLDNGRNAEDPIRLFKYLLLKSIYNLSDVDVVERSRTDLALKFFLDMAPEEDVIHPSLLTKFRKLRLKDMDLLNMLLKKSVSLAIENGIIKENALVVDSTHTGSRYNKKSPQEYLKDLAKKTRKIVYQFDETAKERMPEKVESNDLEEVIVYTQKVIDVIEKEKVSEIPDVQQNLNLLKEVLNDDLEQIQSMNDQEARVGHKTAYSSYFGYKTHLGMSLERIIISAIVTTGEKHDGKQLQALLEQAEENGLMVKRVIGDAAYSESENIKYTNLNDIQLISRLSKTVKTVTHGNHKNADKFEYNKDADRYVCQAGHMSIKKTSTRAKKHAIDGEGTIESYWFDVEKCKNCPFKDGCYKDGAKTKSYSVTIKSNTHEMQAQFQESESFKDGAKHRYMIEAKNGELKNRHGFNRANSVGLFGMEMQAATTIFAVNLKRIIKLMD